ncbi:S8 family serine peptidase [Geobacter sp. DSM 9736]|uniref:S8 family serine peptidase n=1 Tax=Geobacter sp. DSM 9736 TaxID=1277350 RepID=UPI000B50B71A|nr:S8 family serine peptidase [Geobacter sp. DSM 9736]SNB47977.1 Subtilase family protein [Geobacter sp. DSM 9736]
MKRRIKRYPIFFPLVILFCMAGVGPAGAGNLDPRVVEVMETGSQHEFPIIVRATGKARVDSIRDRDKRTRRSKIIRALRRVADASQREIRNFLDKKKIRKVRPLWLVNGVALTANAQLIQELAQLPQVESIILDASIPMPKTVYSNPASPEWNIAAVGAPELWNLGYTGEGVVVANMDSGVDASHPDLRDRWRGGTNSWFDPNQEHDSPADRDGHGTKTMGIMVGGDAGGSSIGVAPGARWIAVKIFNDAGAASYSSVHRGFQWLLDPDGNPDTDDAPDVVNNSWGIENTYGCITEFHPDIEILKAAGIAMTFAAGNDGPFPSTIVSPADYSSAFSVGAVDSTGTVASFSSRGPSACGGGISPVVVAPGVDILTTDLDFGIPGAYATVSGTSFAAPHAAGAMALLIQAFPDLDASVIEAAFRDSAGDVGVFGPDNAYGYGSLNVPAAYNRLRANDRIGVFRGGRWHLDLNGTRTWDAGADSSFSFGNPGDIPVAGSWTGAGTQIGVFRSGAWYLDMNGNGAWEDGIDDAYSFGIPTDIPVTGKWNGGSATKIGVFRNGAWYLDMNGNGTWDIQDASRYFGIPGDKPVTGDWTGTGTTRIGVVRGNTWFLDMNGNGSWDDGIDAAYTFGNPDDVPVTGDWNGGGTTKIGVIRGGTWFLDMNGNGFWDEGAGAVVTGFGIHGDVPVTGAW